MKTIVALYENDWDNAMDFLAWRQLKGAYLSPSDSLVMSIDTSIEAALAEMEGQKVFLIPPGRTESSVDLSTYTHPTNPVYIFGSASDNLLNYIGPDDDVVHITTPGGTDMFGVSAGAIVLDHEYRQQN